ncbi:MAG: hypothetical protein GYB67_01610 [Chloroflexi bacterium]|nr:hypothetical protein [Chloroflexota bacterium]
MANFLRERFADTEISVDGNQYEACTFTNVTLLFGGGEPPSFARCTFTNVRVQLTGQAAETTTYLNALYRSGATQAVDMALERAERGFFLLPEHPEPCPALNEGNHYGRLAIYAGVVALVVGWYFIIYLVGYFIQPYAILDADPAEPVISEVSFDLIPSLPDDLAATYDMMRDTQLAQLAVYEFITDTEELGNREFGVVRIPIDAAFDVLLDPNYGPSLPVRTEEDAPLDSTEQARGNN